MPILKSEHLLMPLPLIKLFVLSFLLSSCGIIVEQGTNQSGNNDYFDAVEVDRIQIPADYNQDNIIDLYPIPLLSEAAEDGFIKSEQLPLPTSINSSFKELVQLQALDGDYWVLVKETPSQIWAKLKQFTELSDLQAITDNPALGLLDEKDNKGISYRFKVIQGLQAKSSEISLRTLKQPPLTTAQFPSDSDYGQLELDTLESLTKFLTEHQAQAAYSFAALGISNQKRIVVRSDEQSAIKYLLIKEQEKRTKASLSQALLAANFEIIHRSENNISARFLPQLPDDEQPGFFLRLFGVSPKLFDEDIEFGGESYIFSLSEFNQRQKLTVNKTGDFDWESDSSKKRELNTILLMIKRSLY